MEGWIKRAGKTKRLYNKSWKTQTSMVLILSEEKESFLLLKHQENEPGDGRI